MRIVFAGTPEFSVPALRALHAAGHDLIAVLTQPDRASGRGQQLTWSPVKTLANELHLEILQPSSLRPGKPGADSAQARLRALAPDLMVVVAYGLILPPEVLALPKWGCLNIHASLLPRWRGAAPIQRAIEAGDLETGVALMQMEEGLDTGPVWQMDKTPILPDDSYRSLHDRLSEMGAQSLVTLLSQFPPAGRFPKPQPAEGATYANKIQKNDLQIDWGLSARQVCCKVRAFDPLPGALTFFEGEPLKIFQAQEIQTGLKNGQSGQIIKADREGLWVACGEGAISVGGLQRAGAKRMDWREFLNGKRVTVGQVLDRQAGNQ